MTAVVSQPDVVGQIVLLQPEQIDASSRLLPIDPVWVEALAAMMKADGQLTPVEVCRLPGRTTYTLVTGGHRHAAAEKAGLPLRAEVITNDATERKLREASENVNRRSLPPLDRAKAIAELVAVQKLARGLEPEQDGRAASAHARWQDTLEAEASDANDILSLAYGWVDRVAEQAGVHKRAIYRDIELLRRIPASIAEALRRRDHPVFHNAAQLKALAGLEPAEQSKVLGLLLHADAVISGAPFEKVTDAVAAMRGRTAPLPQDKRRNAFVGTFGRMPLAEKKVALSELRHQLPKGWTLFEGDAPAAQSFPTEHARYRDETLETIDQLRELIDGLIEDETLDDERHSVAGVLAAKLQLARMTIAGNGFDMGGEA